MTARDPVTSRAGTATAPVQEARLPGRFASRAGSVQDTSGALRAWRQAAMQADLPAVRSDHVRVQRGDTLWGLVERRLAAQGPQPSAAAIHQAVRAVASANGIADPNRIFAADIVDLSVVSRRPAVVAGAATEVGVGGAAACSSGPSPT